MSKRAPKIRAGNSHHRAAHETQDNREPVPPAAGPPRAVRWALLATMAVAVVAVYLPSLDGKFLSWDDDAYVSENSDIRGDPADVSAWALTSHQRAVNWHPLTWISHAVDVQLFGIDSAWGHHLTSVLLHAANAVLLAVLLLRLTRRFWVALAIATLFAFHPLRVEVVAWVAERKELLAWFFSLLTMLAYLRYVERPGVLRYLLVALGTAAALMAKPMAVTLPLLLLLLDIWPLQRLSWRAVLEKAPLFLFVAGACAMTLIAQQVAKAPLDSIDLPARFGNAAVAAAGYLGLTLLPAPGFLRPFYTHPALLPDGVRASSVIFSILVLLVLTSMAILERRRRPYLLWGWLWFLVTLVPVIGLVQVGSQGMADRYTYVPLIGPVVAVVLLLADLIAGRAALGRVAAVVCLLLTGTLGWLTVTQEAVWADSATMWRYNVAHEPGSYVSHLRLGDTLKKEDRWAEAVGPLRESVRLSPGCIQARNSLAFCLAKLWRSKEAVAECEEAIRLLPKNRETFHAETRHTYGEVLLLAGQYEDAAAEFRAALEDEPKNLGALDGLGRALAQQGRGDAAVEQFEKALEINADYLPVRSNLVRALGQMGRLEEAIEHGRRAVELSPRDPEVRCNLATALKEMSAKNKDEELLKEAMDHYAAADRFRPGIPEVYTGWAQAEEQAGRPAAAVRLWRKAAAARPGNVAFVYRLALAQRDARDYDGAVATLRTVLRMNPAHGPAKRDLAELERLKAAPSTVSP